MNAIWILFAIFGPKKQIFENDFFQTLVVEENEECKHSREVGKFSNMIQHSLPPLPVNFHPILSVDLSE